MYFTHSMSQFRLAGFQMLNGRMWLMATVLISSALDYFCGYLIHFSLNAHNRSGGARSHLQRWLVFLQLLLIHLGPTFEMFAMGQEKDGLALTWNKDTLSGDLELCGLVVGICGYL